jgi:hypothetical protein
MTTVRSYIPIKKTVDDSSNKVLNYWRKKKTFFSMFIS